VEIVSPSGMTRTFDDIWISSIEHLNSLNEITKTNGWWKTVLGKNKIPPGFPQVSVGGKYIPVVFFVKGTLQLFERQIEFHPNRFEPENGKKYRNLNIDFRFELPYDSIELSVYSNPKPFMRSFNIQWLKLSGKNNEFPDILLSSGGKRMSQIKKENEKLLGLLTAKISLQPEVA
jgi:hypothetical protein